MNPCEPVIHPSASKKLFVSSQGSGSISGSSIADTVGEYMLEFMIQVSVVAVVGTSNVSSDAVEIWWKFAN